MVVELRRLDSRSIELKCKGFPLPFVNVLRRYALAKVPCMAVDIVRVIDNNSVLFDEILAHRLGLIPLYSEEALRKYREVPLEKCAECSENIDSCPKELVDKCFVFMVLRIESRDRELTVYSRDIKSYDPDVYPVYDNIPIVVLGPGQRIWVEMFARLSNGLEHAKWSPATVAVSRYVADVVVDESLCTGCGKCASVCPRGVLKVDGGKVNVVNAEECVICKQCVANCPSKAIDVVPRDDEYVLHIESSGALKPTTIVREAANILIGELESMLDKVSKWRRELSKGEGS